MGHSFHSILKSNQALFQRLWHALAILLVLVSNLETLTTSAQAQVPLEDKPQLPKLTNTYKPAKFSRPTSRSAVAPISTSVTATTSLACTDWNLTSDFRLAPNQENPNRDACNNPGVWGFMESSNLTRTPASYSLLSVFTPGVSGIPGFDTWFGTYHDNSGTFPSIALNGSGENIGWNGYITYPVNTLAVHTAPSQLMVIAWHSPLQGNIAITGGLNDNDPGCGDGILWYIDKNSTNLASGGFYNGGSQAFAMGDGGAGLNAITVNVGDVIYLAVHPNGDHLCDTTGVDLAIKAFSILPGETTNSSDTTQDGYIGCFACSQANRGGPINTRTGGYDYSATDISIPTTAGNISFKRNYSSLSLGLASLGYGWTHNHDMYLSIGAYDRNTKLRTITLKGHTANRYKFAQKSGSTTTTADPGIYATLVQGPSSFVMTDKSQSKYEFNLTTGRLISYTNATGQKILYTFDGSARLTKISDQGGQHYLTLAYSGKGTKIASVTDNTGRKVFYGYDANNNLVSVTDVLGKIWKYTYDTGHRILQVLDPKNAIIERTEYDTQGRAVRKYDGANNLVAGLTYNADGTTTIKDALNNIETHKYDVRKTLAGETDPTGGAISKTYDNNFRPETIKDANGNKTSLSWSANGADVTHIEDALHHSTSISYDALGNATSIVDPSNYETKYFYENTNFPNLPTKVEYPLSFDGGITYTSVQYEYYQPGNIQGQPAGKLKLMTDALGNQTFYKYTSTGQSASITSAYGTLDSQTVSYTYDSVGNLVNQTDAQGIVTHHEYDAAQRLTKTIRNYDTARPQNDQNKYNLTTAYRYDASGYQIAVIDTRGTITRTYYDSAGRLATTVRNLVGQTIDTATPPARGSAVDQNLRTDTIYDADGNVIATIDQAGLINRTYYDAAGRPVTTVANLAGQDVSVTTPPERGSENQNIRTDTVYDANGNAIATIDPLGIITRTYFDELNRPVTTIQNLTGRSISVVTPPERITSSDQNLRTDIYYDANGNTIASVDPAGVITRTYYDSMNRSITVVQNLSGQAVFDPNPPERNLAEPDVNLRTDTYYDQAGNAIATQDPMGIVTRTYYDQSNRPVTVVQNLVGQDIYVSAPPIGGATDENIRTKTTYDQNGRQSTTTDSLGQVTRYEYDLLGQMAKTTLNYLAGKPQNYQNQYNLVNTNTYDALGRAASSTDTLGRTSTTSYDVLGRTLTSTQNYLADQAENYQNQYNIITSYTYDISGNRRTVRDSNHHTTTTNYDALGRQTSIVDANGNSTFTTYNVAGNVLSTTDSLNQTITYGYDALNRQTSVTDTFGHITHYEYNTAGNRISMTDANGVTTSYEYNNIGRLTAVVENYKPGVQSNNKTNIRTEYTYDLNGNRLTIKDGNGHITTFDYDHLGRLLSESDPLGHTWQYTYDKGGNRLSMIDANGKTTTYAHDSINRQTGITYPGSDPAVSFSYDAASRRTGMTDGLGTTNWSYDQLNRPISITDPFGKTVGYSYDAMSNRTGLIYPSTGPGDQSASYTYDVVNRLTKVVDWSARATQYTYDPVGRLLSVLRPNNVNSSFTYNDAGQLTQLQHATSSGPLSIFQYTYDKLGNRSQAIETMQVRAIFISGNTGVGGAVVTYTGGSITADESGNYSFTVPSGWTGTVTPSKLGYAFSPVSKSYTNVAADQATQNYIATYTTYTISGNAGVGGAVVAYTGGSTTANDSGSYSFSVPLGWTGTVTPSKLGYVFSPVSKSYANVIADQPTQDYTSVYTTYTISGNAGIGNAVVAYTGGSTTADDSGNYSFSVPHGWAGTVTPSQNGYTFAPGSKSYSSTPVTSNLSNQNFSTLSFCPTGQTTGNDLFLDGFENGTANFSTGATSGPNQWSLSTDKPSTGAYSLHANDADFVTDTYARLANSLLLPTGAYLQFAHSYSFDSSTYPYDGGILEYSIDGGTSWTNATNLFDVGGYNGTIRTGYSNPLSNLPGFVKSSNGYIVSRANLSSLAGKNTLFRWRQGTDSSDGGAGWYIDDIHIYTCATEATNTPTPTLTATETPTATATEVTETRTPTETFTATPLPTFTPTASPTEPGQVETPTETPVAPTTTPTPTNPELTATESPSATETLALEPTVTLMGSNGGFYFASYRPQSVQRAAKTKTPTPTRPTSTPSATPSFTPTPTAAVPTITPTFTFTPTATNPPTPTPPSVQQTVKIDYIYDPLNRLTKASYSDPNNPSAGSRSYEYTYDKVGNRLSQTITINGQSSVTSYQYDDANRLTSVNGVAYTYDDNGNLLSDGTNTYTYDSANRLKTVTSSQGAVTSYQYNGLGDRLKETTGGVTTTFTMDLNSSLTQVLSDGTYNYLYGNGRIAQTNAATTEYFLGDALDSVRQLIDTAGAVTLTKAYDPYGVVSMVSGTGSSSYGYTGEQQDSSGMVYLRARYYTPNTGRFLTRDTWNGNANQPTSYNRWMYVEGNPINRTDPQGKCYVIEDGDGVWYPNSSKECLMTPGKRGKPPAGPSDGSIYVQDFGGAQLWQVYLSMMTCKSAWWNKGEDTFNVKTLIGLMILAEANFSFGNSANYADLKHGTNVDDRTKALVTVAATNLYYGGGFRNRKCAQKKQGNCIPSAMNYWAGYSQVTRKMILDYYQVKGNPAGFDNILDDWLKGGPASAGTYSKKNPQPQFYEILREAHRLGVEAFKPSNGIPGGPTEYGNNSNWADFVHDHGIVPYVVNGVNEQTIYYYTPRDNKGWIVFNFAQYNYWSGQGAPVDDMDE